MTDNRYTLELTNGSTGFSQMHVGHYDTTTAGFDSGYDAPAMTDSSLFMGSLIAESNSTFAVNALDSFNPATTIPLRFRTQVTGTFTITLAAAYGIFENAATKVYLLDTKAGLTHDFSEGAYTFTSDAGNFLERFQLVYENTTLSVTTPVSPLSDIVVYTNNQELYVKSNNSDLSEIMVYSLEGKLLVNHKMKFVAPSVQLPLNNVKSQLVLVKVITTDAQVKTQKLLLQ
jgi:hypothetical protein